PGKRLRFHHAGAEDEADRGEEVLDIVCTDERAGKADCLRLAFADEIERNAVEAAPDVARSQGRSGRIRAGEAHDALPAQLASERRDAIVVEVEDCGSSLRQELAEESSLGVEVGVERAVIVEMIARE